MARAETYTLLALDRYASVMHIPLPHFNQAAGSTIFPIGPQCSQVWYSRNDQSADKVSREELAEAIATAEEEIAKVLGFWPAPMFIRNEIHTYPRYHRPELITGGMTNRGQWRSLQADFGKFIAAGQRGLTLVGSPNIVFNDLDGDGFDETATVVIATALTDACEVKVYFEGHDGDPEWEIRPARSKTIAAGVFTAQFWVWQVIQPLLWDAFPTSQGASPLNLQDPAIYENTVDVYREFVDFSQASARFFWEPQPMASSLSVVCGTCGGSGCPACTLQAQDGCLHVRDVHPGLLVPQPASWDADDEEWSAADWVGCREPDLVKINYYAGDLDQKFLSGRSCEPLKLYWAEAIAWLATARLSRPFCSCGAVEKLVSDLRWDTARTASNEPTYTLGPRDADNPFGTLLGEVKAWRRVARFVGRRQAVAVV